jgi:hypothetical protein
MAWTRCGYCRLRLVFGSRWTCDSKNSPEFEHAVAVIESSLWMLGEEEGLSETSPVVAQGGGAIDVAEQ